MEDITGLSAGTYSVTVTDANNCTASLLNIDITESPALTLTGSVIQIACVGVNSGSINVTLGGGTPTYSFLWSGTDFSLNPILLPNSTQQNQSNLGPGTYSVQVTDFNGCILNSQTWTITNPLTSPSIQNINIQNVNCFGNNTGSISFLATGGTPDYDVELDGILQGNIPTSGGTLTISSLTAGTYILEIIDNNGCVDTEPVTITQPNSAVVAVVDSVNNVSCNGLSDGDIFATISGGTAPYSFLWSVVGGVGGPIPAGQIASEDPQGLPDGNYQLLVTDALGCTNTVITQVTEPTPINIVWTDSGPLCDGNSLGFINLQLSGGTPNANSPLYNTLWQWAPLQNPGINCSATNIPNNTFSPSSLTCGIYTVTVTDANGCTAQYTDSIIITPTPFQANFTSTNIQCFGQTDGTITVTPTTGTAPFNVVITNGGFSINPPGNEIFTVNNGYTVNNLAAGIYNVTITDNNGCQDVATVTITAPQNPITASVTPVDVSCFGGNNGSFSVAIIGGTGPFSLNVDPAGVIPAFTTSPPSVLGLTANSYSVTVLDVNQCASNPVTVVINQPAALTAIITGTPINCFGDCSAGISAAVSGGTLPYTYQWTSGVNSWNTPNINNLCAGNYQFSMTDANGCPYNSSYSITQPPSSLVVNILDTVDVSCYGAHDGEIIIAINGGTANYTVTLGGASQIIDPNLDNTATFSNLSPGVYVLTVTDALGCVETINFDVDTPPALTLNVVPTNILCAGQNTGELLITANGGEPTLSYVVTGPTPSNGIIIGGTPLQIGGVLNPPSLAPGPYTVVVTDINGCSVTVSTNITVPNPIQIDETITYVLCHGLSTGQITTAVSGGAGGYTYSWVASNGGVLTSGASAASQINVPAGTYTLTVTDANNCPYQEIYTVTQPQLPLSASISSFTHVNCANAGNGQITISISGGTPTYTVNGGAPVIGNTATFPNLSGGSYSFTVTDINGCQVQLNQLITEPAPLTLGITSTNNVACHGAATGSLSFTTSGGTAPINYSIVGPPNFSGTIPTTSLTTTPIGTPAGILPAGNYTVNIIDANGCTNTISTTITQPSPIVVTPTITNILCFGQGAGAISTTTSGGVAPFTYLWSNSNPTPNITGVPAGPYTLTVTDANGCTNIQSFTITAPALALSMSLTTPVNISCNGANDGSIQVTASGGTAGYQVTYQRTTPPGPLVSPTGVEIPLSGGSYTVNNLSPGNYTLTVVDANGCSTQNTFTITEPPAFGATVSANTILCNPGNTGVLTITTPPGSYPVTYVINGPGGPNSGNINTSPFLLNNLPGGNYLIDLTYNNGLCSQQLSATINQPANPISVTPTVTNVPCAGVNSGSICLNVTGGTGPYSYAWSIPGNTSCQNNLAPGTYNVTVTDANNCSVPNTYTISGPVSPLVADSSFTNVLCLGQNDGTITITANGGTPTYTLTSATLLPASTTINLTGGTYQYTNVAAGTHVVLITDANGCTDSETITITQPQNPLNVVNLTTTDVQCYGDMNGSIAFNVTGGTAPYTVVWSANGLPAVCSVPASSVTNSGIISATGLCQGDYSVNITDLNGCTYSFAQSIIAPNLPLTASATQTNILCHGQCTGIATTVPSGGTAPYQHSWSNGQTTPSITGLCIGDYYDTITDANGCEIIVQFSITAPAQPMVVTISDVDVDCFDNATGSITVSATGGTPGYNVSWTPGPPFPVAGLEILNSGDTYTIPGLLAGTYTLNVQDLNNCPFTQNVIISQPAALTYSVASANVTCNGASNGSINVTVNGGVLPYTYLWNSTAGSPCSIPINQANATGLCPGIYDVLVTDANGCQINTGATIIEPDLLVISVVNDTVYCLPGTGGSQAIVSGGTPSYTINWQDVSGTTIGSGISIANLAPGVYNAVVVDANNCQNTAPLNIIGPAAPLTAAISHTNETCTNNNDGTITIIPSGGTAPFTITGSPWNGSPTVAVSGGNAVSNNMVAGSYTYTITDAYLCQTTVSTTITQPTYLQVALQVTNVTCHNDNDGIIQITPSGSVPNYTVTWISGPNSGPCALPVTSIISGATNFTGLCPGVYVFSVTDANGCDTTLSATVSEPSPIVLSSSTIDVLCHGNATGQASILASGGTPGYTYNWVALAGSIPAGQSTNQTIGSPAPNGIPTGTYQVTVTDANGCDEVETVNINQPATPLLALIDHTDELCFPVPNQASTGTISVGANGGTGPYTISGNNFVWTGPSNIVSPSMIPFNPLTGQTMTGVSANLAGAPYAITVTDSYGCISTASVVVGSPAALSVVTTPTNLLCNGDINGSINVAPTGGVSPYTVNWLSGPTGPGCVLPVTLNTSSNVSTPSTLCPGAYTIEVIDANGCKDTVVEAISEPAPLNINYSVNDVLCYGDSSGQISTQVSGGTGPYTYNWTTLSTWNGIPYGIPFPTAANQPPGNPNHPFGLPAGTYLVTVNDANGNSGGCHDEVIITITQPATPVAGTLTPHAVDCNSNATGSIDITASGGVGPYAVTRNNNPIGTILLPGGTITETGLIAGNYTYVITDANGCDITLTTIVSQPAPLLVTVNNVVDVSCVPGSFNGEIHLDVNGGNGYYSYNWITAALPPFPLPLTTPVGGPSVTNLYPGVYTVMVTDLLGCQDSLQVTVNQFPGFTVTSTIGDIQCHGNNTGSINLTLNGGTPNFTFQWTGPNGYTSIFQNIIGLGVGQYNVIVTDGAGCVVPLVATVSEPSSALTSTVVSSNVACYGDNSGTISITATGGTPFAGPNPYTYEWYFNSTTLPPFNTTQTISNLVAGVYICVVTDANGCQDTQQVVITQPATALTYSVITTDVTCFGGSNGAIDITVSGGTGAPYSLLWNTGETTEDLANLAAGIYTLTITDNGPCTITTAPITIIQPSPIVITPSILNVGCHGDASGMITTQVSGGTVNISAGYTFLWSTVNGLIPAGQATLPNIGSTTHPFGLTPGDYNLLVTDANGCTSSLVATVIQPLAPLYIASTYTNVDCFGDSSGTINVYAEGGTLPYNVSWSGTVAGDPFGFEILSNPGTYTITSLPAGTYNFQVVDQNGCSLAGGAVITQNSLIDTLNTAIDSIFCANSSDGFISVSITGGVPNALGAPYTMVWSGVDPAGNNIPMLFTSVTGNTTTASNLVAGTYTLTVTDAINCTRTFTYVMTEIVVSLDSVVDNDILCKGQCTGEIEFIPTGGDATYTVSVFPIGQPAANTITITEQDLQGSATGIFSLGGLCPGQYYVLITDANNCSANTPAITITEPSTVFSPSVNVISNSGCNDNAGILNVQVMGGTPGYNVAWHNITDPNIVSPAGTEINQSPGNYLISGLSSGFIEVLVTDNVGCEIVDTVEIDDTEVTFANFTAVDSAGCGPYLAQFTNLSLGENLSYFWSFGNGQTSTEENPSVTFDVGGPYDVTLTVTNAFGCTSTMVESGYIVSYASPNAAFTISSTGVDYYSGLVEFINNSVNAQFYTWDFGHFSNGSTEVNPTYYYPQWTEGDYIVTLVATDTNGCSDQAQLLISSSETVRLNVPNTVTIDDNGLNELFFPVFSNFEEILNFKLEIFNRWGELIFETKDIQGGWNGTYNGVPVQSGTYTWKVTYKDLDGFDYQAVGHINVLR